MLNCKTCGVAFKRYNARGRTPLHCSAQCRQKWAYKLGPNAAKVYAGIQRRGRERWAAYRAANPKQEKRAVYECQQCGKSITGLIARPRKFCSLSCSVKVQNLSKRRSCDGCGGEAEWRTKSYPYSYYCLPCKAARPDPVRHRSVSRGWRA